MRPATLTGMRNVARMALASGARTPCGISIGWVIHQFVSYMPADTSMRSTPAAFELRRDGANVRQDGSVRLMFVAGDAVEHGDAGPDGLANGGDDRERKSNAALQVAAEFVVAMIAEGREELAEQIAMRAVDADEIATGLDGAPGGCGEMLDQFIDLQAVERDRRRAARTDIRNNGRRARLQSADHGIDHAPAEIQFGADARAMPLDRGHHALEIGDQIVVVQTHLILAALAARIDIGRFGVEQAGAAARARFEVVDIALRDAAFRRAIIPLHRRADDAVAHVHRTDFAGRE